MLLDSGLPEEIHMASQKYTAAIVGCGSIGRAHMEGYSLVDKVEVVAISDPVAAAREQYLREFGDLQAYERVEDMLTDSRPDIVSVCTWHLLHPAPTIAAAEAGVKGVICEKPMAIGMAAADSMVDACEASGTRLVISHQRRFTPGWQKGRELLGQGAIGQPLFVTNKVREGLTNWGTHSIDGSRFVLGDPRPEWVMGAVERRTDRYERDTAIEDACLGLVHFEGDVQLFIQSDLMREGASAGAFQIKGSDGMLEVTESQVRLFNADSGGWREPSLGVEREEIRSIGGQHQRGPGARATGVDRGRPRAPRCRTSGAHYRRDHDGSVRVGPSQSNSALSAGRKGLSAGAHDRGGRPPRGKARALRYSRFPELGGRRH